MFDSIKQLLSDISFKQDPAERIDFDKGFLLPLSIVGIVVSVTSIVINTFLEFNLTLYVIPFISLTFFILIYYLGKKERFVKPAKWLFILTVLVATNLVWYFNYGSNSYWLFLIILLYSYLIFMMSGRHLALLSLVLLIDVGALFTYEYTHSEALGDYPDNQTRIIDSYAAFLLFGVSAYILMSLAKRYYLKEYRKAHESDHLKSQFLSNLSHEVRTPLNAILGFSGVLADEELSKEEKLHYQSIIESSSDSLLQLIDDALDASLIEAGQISLESASFCVNDLMAQLETTYVKAATEANKGGLTIKGESPIERVFITSDQTRITQIFVKLLDNALKFTEKGFIKFGFTLKDNQLHFYVSDSGIGMEEKYKEQIFNRFFKIEDQIETLYRGAGLGLYLTKRNVELLSGSIWVESKLGAGSTFYFNLPATDLELKQQLPDRVQTDDEPVEMRQIGSLLIVEDDPASMTLLTQMVSPFTGHLFKAVNGMEAVNIFKENSTIELVLLDIQLPDSNGFEILKQLRYINPQVKVIAQTAYVSEKDKNMCFDAGFDDYIAKPIDKKKLLAIMNK